MNERHYLNGILTVIAGLLLVLVLQGLGLRGASFPQFARPAYAATQAAMSGDVWIFPVGNQDVRKWVVFDRRTSVLYKYDDDGTVQDSWDVRGPGEKFQKRH